MKIGVVGPCGAGKTTLVDGLSRLGYKGKHIAQEHSYVPAMWQRLAKPDVLVYLGVSHTVAARRRQLNWTEAEYQEQLRRLAHARAHADLIIETDGLTPEQVLEQVVRFLNPS